MCIYSKWIYASWTYAVGLTGNDDAPPVLEANERTDPALVYVCVNEISIKVYGLNIYLSMCMYLGA
jgi:hypothetical protein